MQLSFKRITSSGSFIPEIDGLRFIAIASVVLYHLNGFLTEKYENQTIDASYNFFLKHLLSHGHLGVPLFFTISGFILGMPFAKFHICNGKPVNLKNYFLRRLSRLEPPYILTMTILLFGAVYAAKTISLSDGIKSYLASIIYSHNFIFHTMSKLNSVTWSLELEVQFYILAPLIAYLFSIKSLSIRRLSIFLTAVLFAIINHFNFNPVHFISLVNYLQYFLIGFLLTDLYVSNSTLVPKTKFDYLIGLFFFVIIWLFDNEDFKSTSQRFIWELIQLTSIFFLYYYVLFHKIFKFLSFKLITNIGGMCYSIYLLHYPIISMFGNPLLKYSFSKYTIINISIYSAILILLVMLISSIFFLLIERPCMDKNWYKKIFFKQN
ncbi:acyltransferase family protein [Flavobacterium fluviale]|uniref:Acyltransferase 3 domain-containing protein n=1 Tax=Flavobacterium fluviale TaxID=2249356 RepID=A0A344LQ29_9FLAO|nr:acyltransferase [Flavobacterium fluviale]AXB56021.1 hypothetical protein HYN86_05140 [Flavobacterium fluviale]